MPAPTDYEIFELGDLVLQQGATLRDARLAYRTYGTLDADKSNVIVYPTWFSAWHDANEWTIGPGMACDPGECFIVVPNQLDNGLSTLTEQQSAAVQRSVLPAGHVPRPGRGPAPAAHTEVGHRVPGAGPRARRWAPARPTSGRSATPRWSSGLRPSSVRPDQRAQPGLPEEPAGGADRGPRLRRRPLLPRRPAHARAARVRPHLRRLGALPGVLLAARVPAAGLLLARGLPGRVLGGLLARRPRPEQPARHALDLGARRRRARPRGSTGTPRRRCVHPLPAHRHAGPRRTSTSRPRTSSGRHSSSHTARSASSTPSRPLRRPRLYEPDNGSSTRRSGSCCDRPA